MCSSGPIIHGYSKPSMKLIEKWAYIYAHTRIPVNKNVSGCSSGWKRCSDFLLDNRYQEPSISENKRLTFMWYLQSISFDRTPSVLFVGGFLELSFKTRVIFPLSSAVCIRWYFVCLDFILEFAMRLNAEFPSYFLVPLLPLTFLLTAPISIKLPGTKLSAEFGCTVGQWMQ